jgi:photosystem II stability/assembly factor-like uncharacterized protein
MSQHLAIVAGGPVVIVGAEGAVFSSTDVGAVDECSAAPARSVARRLPQ